MSKLSTTLTSLGLSPSEAAVYERGLRDGDTDIAELSRLLGMNRATTYHAVHELEQKGLLQKRIENGKLVISVLREEGLEAYVNFEESRLNENKQSLQSFFEKLPKPKKRVSMPDIEYYSGFEGIKMALEIAFRTKGQHRDILAPKNNFFSEIDESYALYYLAERKKRNLTARSIWERTESKPRLSREVLQERNPRFLPQKYNVSFRSVMILFDDRALFVSSTKEMQAVLINSADICSTLQLQFNALWEASTSLK